MLNGCVGIREWSCRFLPELRHILNLDNIVMLLDKK